MDPLTVSVVTIISKYAIDAGLTLAKEVGPPAKDTAEKLCTLVLQHLRHKLEGKAIADGFENNPDGYRAPVQDLVESAIQADALFKEQLNRLVNQFEAEKHNISANIQINIGDGGAVATGDKATTMGQGGVIVEGDVQGPIYTGSRNVFEKGSTETESISLAPELAVLYRKITSHFNKNELKELSFGLGIAYDDLKSETRSELALALITYCDRRDRLSDLRDQCKAARPRVDW